VLVISQRLADGGLRVLRCAVVLLEAIPESRVAQDLPQGRDQGAQGADGGGHRAGEEVRPRRSRGLTTAGGRVRIGGQRPQASIASDSARGAGYNQVVLDVEGWRVLAEPCEGK
jgi:hypothetical protein